MSKSWNPDRVDLHGADVVGSVSVPMDSAGFSSFDVNNRRNNDGIDPVFFCRLPDARGRDRIGRKIDRHFRARMIRLIVWREDIGRGEGTASDRVAG